MTDAQNLTKKTKLSDDNEKPVQVKRRGVKYLLAFDVEATGMSLTQHWMPEFGAAFWKVGDKEPLGIFYRALTQPEGTSWCALTRAQFWDNPKKGANGETPFATLEKRLATRVLVEPAEAMRDFVDFVQSCNRIAAAAGETMVCITDTAAFDGGVMNYYLSKFCADKCTYMGDITGEYRPVRDISGFYYGVGKCLQKYDSVETALEVLGIDKVPDWVKEYAHNHDPLSDACSIAATASFILAACDAL